MVVKVQIVQLLVNQWGVGNDECFDECGVFGVQQWIGELDVGFDFDVCGIFDFEYVFLCVFDE